MDAEVPESVIRQVGENEYQAKLHEMQLKVRGPCSTHHDAVVARALLQCSFSCLMHSAQLWQKPHKQAAPALLAIAYMGMLRARCVSLPTLAA